MVANLGGLSNCSRVELNYGVGDFAVPAFASRGMIIKESRVACCWPPTRPSSRSKGNDQSLWLREKYVTISGSRAPRPAPNRSSLDSPRMPRLGCASPSPRWVIARRCIRLPPSPGPSLSRSSWPRSNTACLAKAIVWRFSRRKGISDWADTWVQRGGEFSSSPLALTKRENPPLPYAR